MTHFKWCYNANGAIALFTKVISMGFKDGLLTSFIDNWGIYNVGSTNVNISKEEAVAIALDSARKHSWTMQLDENALTPEKFNQNRSVSWTALTFDGSIDINKTRSEDILELYPVWRVGLVLNKVYGELYGLEVDIWADTKEVRGVKEEYSQLAAQWYENVTTDDHTSAAFINITDASFVIGVVISANIAGIMGACAIKLIKKKNSRALMQPKPRFLKTMGMLLCSLILLVAFLPLIGSASATTRSGIVWGARSSGAPNNPISYSWRKTDAEIDKQQDTASYIASNFFTSANGYTGYNQQGIDKTYILSAADYLNDNYDYVAVVDFDHGVLGNPGQAGDDYPNVPDNEVHHMFEDDWGTVVGTRDDFESDWSHGVYDIDMYNAFSPSKVHFAFIDACKSADLYTVGQGFWQSSNPTGLPFGFTHRIVNYLPTGTQMSRYGYEYPDSFPQCYIGFPDGSAALDQHIDSNGEYGQGPQWYTWVIFFFYFALDFDNSVKDALDLACDYTWSCDNFLDSPLWGDGFTAVWPMYRYNETSQQWEWMDFPGAATLAVYGNSNIHLKNFQPSDYVTAPSIDGQTSGNVDETLDFSASSLDSKGHIVQYRFDWGDGSTYEETGWYSNGDYGSASHYWSSGDFYTVRVQARCPNTGWGSWSEPLVVNIGNQPVYHWLTVIAVDGQLWYPLYPDIYIDGDYAGYGSVSVQVLEGDHSVWMSDPTWNGYWMCWSYLSYYSDYYGNGDYRPIYSDTEIFGVYY
jgi:hypothetical protein